MRKLEIDRDEVESDGNQTSLTALVGLQDYDYIHSAPIIMDWHDSILIATDIDADLLARATRKWIRGKTKGTVALDIEQAFADLIAMPSTVLIRYYAADNGRDEMLVAVGHKQRIDVTTIDCLDLIRN